MIIRRLRKRIVKPIISFFAYISKSISFFMFKRLHNIEWSIDFPEFYNHDCDLYYQWEEYNRSYWVERGVYNILALQNFENPVLVELCCGEGFNTKYFYSYHATDIYACDFSKEAIKNAKKKYLKDNIFFEVADIRYNIPNEVNGRKPTNIIWDAAIEHFTPNEINSIMSRIHSVLEPTNGILSGYTITKSDDKHLEQHEYEFENMDDLKRFLTPYFKNVIVFETIYRDRTNLYFWASDGVIPFADDWKHISRAECKS